MSSVLARALTISAFTAFAFTSLATAQTPATVFNTLELERLVASAVPDDHQRVSVHFATLADRYTADAARHEQIASSYARNPVAKLGRDMADHCRTLARIDRELAVQLRDLSAQHAAMAHATGESGAASPALQILGSPLPTDDDLTRLAATATTAADHQALGRYFASVRDTYIGDASQHRRLALYYAGIKAKAEAAHCERVARLANEGAKAAGEAAARHLRQTTTDVTSMGTSAQPEAPRMLASVDPSDHRAVAEGFRAEQARAATDAKEHVRLASYYRMSKLFSEAAHCERAASAARQASEEAAAAAQAHEAAGRPSR